MSLSARLGLLLSIPAATFGQSSFTGASIIGTPGSPSQTLYATRSGLFKSIDLGATWTALYLTEPGLPQPGLGSVTTAAAFAIDPFNDSNLFFGTTGARGVLWKSTDAGATWALANTGLPTGDAKWLRFYAANRSLYVLVNNRLYKSADNAATWVLQGALPGTSAALDICASTPARMYYGSGEGMYRTDDEGRTWNFLTLLYPPPPPEPGLRNSIGHVGVDPNNGCSPILASAAGPYGELNGIYRNASAGAGSFQKVPGASYVSGFFLGAGSYYANSAIGSGIMRSTNQGSTWSTVAQLVLTAVDPKNRSILYSNGAGGSFARSTDAGNNWTTITGTVRPTLSKEAAPLTGTVETGGNSPLILRVQSVESGAWAFPFTAASLTNEPWLTLDATSGTAPRDLIVRISAAGLSPGRYAATIRLSSTGTTNPSVDIPVEITVVAADTNRVDFQVSTVVGSGSAITRPSYLALNNSDELFVAESSSRIWRVPASGGGPVLVAGNGATDGSGDGGPATNAAFSSFAGIAFDSRANLYVTEAIASRLRRISSGTVTLLADRNTRLANGQTFLSPGGVAVDSTDGVLITAGSNVLRYTAPGNPIETTSVNLSPGTTSAEGIAVDVSGNIFVTDRHRVIRVTAQRAVTVYAGGATQGFSGDLGPAAAAELRSPEGLAVDRDGNLYIADTGNNRIRMVSRDGIIRTVAGVGSIGYDGVGGPAAAASIWSPSSIAFDRTGNLYVVAQSRVIKLTRTSPSSPLVSGAANAAGTSAKVSPGGVFSLYGQNLAAATLVTNAAEWPTALGATSVSVNGRLAPIWFVSPGQINAQLPVETPLGLASVSVARAGASSSNASLQVVPAAPGLLACPSCGAGQALATNPDGSLNSPSNPAKPGQYLVVYLIGIGPVEGSLATGTPSPSSPLPRATLPHSITLGGRPAEFVYLGLTPTFVALAQANVLVPNLPAGEHPLVITVGGEASNALNISIRP